MSRIVKFFIIICFEIVSVLIIAILGICYLFGGLNLEIFEYGIIFYIGLILFIISIIFIPFFLIKYKIKYITVIYLLIVIVSIIGLSFSSQYIREKYNEFSYDLWANYEVIRQVMYLDLENDKTFLSYNKEEVVKKLGKPDSEDISNFYYNTSPGDIVVEFDNDIVKKIYWRFP